MSEVCRVCGRERSLEAACVQVDWRLAPAELPEGVRRHNAQLENGLRSGYFRISLTAQSSSGWQRFAQRQRASLCMTDVGPNQS